MSSNAVTGAIRDANRAALEMYACGIEDLIGHPPGRLGVPNTPYSSQAGLDHIRRALAEGPQLFEWQARHQSGEDFWTEVALRSSVIGGQPCVLGVARDITQRKRTEESLRQVTDRLILATNAGGVGIWDYDAVNQQLVWDEQMYRLYGLAPKPQDNASPAWDAGLHPDDRQRCHVEVQRALRGERVDTDYRIVWPDGTTHSLRSVATLRCDAAGQILHLVGTSWDITAQKQLEEQLRLSEENFRTFFDSMTDMIIVGGHDGHILHTNAAVTQTLGYTALELASLHVLDLHPPGRRQEAQQSLAEMFRGERQSCPLPLAHRNGSEVPVETRVWFGRWNGIDCIFGVSKNLTVEQEAQARFEHLFRNNPALMALTTVPDGRFFDVNNAFLKSLGYSREEVLGQTASELGLLPDLEQQAAVAEQLGASGRVADLELQLRRKDGVIVHGLFSGDVKTL